MVMENRFDSIVFVPGKNYGRYPYCHSVYVEADLKVVIDPASDRDRLGKFLTEPGVDAVWLSHWHEDHFKYLYLFDEQELWISESDAPPLQDIERFMDWYGMNGEETRFWKPFIVEQFHYRPRQADRLFRGEETIDLGGLTVDVIPTPGHTPGHRSFFFREPGVLFLGDYDLTPFGPWYGDIYSDIEAVIASVNRLRGIPARVWIASHEQGLFESEPGDLWDRYLHTIEEREAKLLDFLHKPRNMNEIVNARILYGKPREPKEFFDFGERVHMAKHLERLISRGMVMVRDDTYHLT
jgi:hydroxyacylglutathione hydrolase